MHRRLAFGVCRADSSAKFTSDERVTALAFRPHGMSNKALGLCLTLRLVDIYSHAAYHAVFVTGNTHKLKEVRAILSEGPSPINLESRDLDGMLAAN